MTILNIKQLQSQKVKFHFSINKRKQVSLNLELQSALNDQRVDAILNVAGGWAGGNASDKGNSNYIRSIAWN